jgi:A/G-specific adenine glycosylase
LDTRALLDWYTANRRELPWRTDPDPYGVWLCEVMSQQTRIETMLPYWRRFQARWPTVGDLAAADLDEVLGEWAGLGYYSRARNLHAAAQQIAALGAFPDTVKGLRALPGVGPYTAGAIGSIALGLHAAVVDGNVERVLCRHDHINQDPRTPTVRKALWARAQALLPQGRAGDFNQALMELGASVCSPRAPECPACPIQATCQGQAQAEQLPNKPRKTKQPEVRGACAAIWQGERVLLARRPDTGLLAGLWELPGLDPFDGDEEPALGQALRERLGVPVTLGARLGQVRHVFTHRKLTLGVWSGAVSGALAPTWYTGAAWFDPHDLDGLGVSTLARKALAIAVPGVQGRLL